MKKHKKILFDLGNLICLTGARLTFDETILDKTTANIANVFGITAIYLIATQRRAIVNGGE